MAEQVTVVHVGSTGHALGLVTRTAGAEELPVEELVGARFPVRNLGDVAVELPVSHLSSAPVDATDDLYVDVQKCRIVDGAVVVEAVPFDPADFVLSATEIQVNLPAPAVEDTPVFCQLDSGVEDRAHTVFEKVVAPTESGVVIPRSFQPGDYDCLVLVPGFLPLVELRTLP